LLKALTATKSPTVEQITMAISTSHILDSEQDPKAGLTEQIPAATCNQTL
jgi:hypothetical protein